MKKVIDDVHQELQTTIEAHGLFTSAHHGYAIILEELDELWDEIKKKRSMRDVRNMRAEAVQVAAMAMKFIVSMEAEWKTINVSEIPYKGAEGELKKIEQKCTSCRYDLVTKEILDELGYNPCERCGEDCREWEPKEIIKTASPCAPENCNNSCKGWVNCDSRWSTREVPSDV